VRPGANRKTVCGEITHPLRTSPVPLRSHILRVSTREGSHPARGDRMLDAAAIPTLPPSETRRDGINDNTERQKEARRRARISLYH
jgi:hypothetical protein